ADRNPAAAKRIAEDDRVRHPRHRRGAQARRQGRGVWPRRCAAAVRRTVPPVVEPCWRLRGGFHRRRPRISRASVPARDRAVAARHSNRRRNRDRRPHIGPERLGADRQIRRRAARLGQRRRCGATPQRQLPVRQHLRRRIAVPARRLAAPGTGRGVVVPVRAGRGGRRRRPSRGRGAGRRCVGGAERATAESLAEARPCQRRHGRLSVRYLLSHLDDAWALTVIHLRLSLIPIVLGLLIAVPLGALIQRTTTLRRLTTITASIIFTIPSLALFVVLPLIIPTRILDEANVIVALTLYTTALLVRAVPEALDAVPEPVRDAATAVGYK